MNTISLLSSGNTSGVAAVEILPFAPASTVAVSVREPGPIHHGRRPHWSHSQYSMTTLALQAGRIRSSLIGSTLET